MRKAYSGPEAANAAQRLPYHGTAGTLPSLISLMAAPVAIGLIAMLLGGCSMQLSSLLPGGVSDQGPTVIRHQTANQNPDEITTGSIPLQMTSGRDNPMGMSEADWPFAQAALKDALARTQDGPSVPWQNPSSGTHGTVAPIASAFEREGFACRNFIASHVASGVETWSEGTACRMHKGEWVVKTVKPVKKT